MKFSILQKLGISFISLFTFVGSATYTYHDRISKTHAGRSTVCDGVCLWKVVMVPKKNIKGWQFVDGECTEPNTACQCRTPNVAAGDGFALGDIVVVKCALKDEPVDDCSLADCEWKWSSTEGWVFMASNCQRGCVCNPPNLTGAYQPYNGQVGTFIDIGYIIVNGRQVLRTNPIQNRTHCHADPGTILY